MSSWLQARQAEAVDSYEAQGRPTRALEAWKTTPIKPLEAFGDAALPYPNQALIDAAASLVASLPAAEGPRLVLVSGHRIDALSSQRQLNLNAEGAEAHLGLIASHEGAPLVALSGRALDRALVIRACESEGAPIEIVHVAVPGEDAGHARVLVIAERSEEVTVIEHFLSMSGDPCWANAVTEVSVGPNAGVRHVQVLRGESSARHTGNVSARVDRDGRFESHVVSLNGEIARSEVLVKLVGQGASCMLRGLYVASGKSVMDNYTEIEHLAPHTTSGEVYRGVMREKATGGFVGRVLIHEGAVKSETHQLNNNLLLSPGAVAHTRPQLEIDNDDVVATHGSTVGQLEEDALFYLRTRGLSADRARALMTWAFVKAQIDALPTRSLRQRCAEDVAQRLAVSTDWVGVEA